MYINIPDNFTQAIWNQALEFINQLILPYINKIENHPLILSMTIIGEIITLILIIKKQKVEKLIPQSSASGQIKKQSIPMFSRI